MLNICLLFRQSTYAHSCSRGTKSGWSLSLIKKKNKLDLGLRSGLGHKGRKVMCLSGLRSLQEWSIPALWRNILLNFTFILCSFVISRSILCWFDYIVILPLGYKPKPKSFLQKKYVLLKCYHSFFYLRYLYLL